MKLNLNYSISITEANKTAKAFNESFSPYNGPDSPDNNTEIEPIINKDPTPTCMDEIHVLDEIHALINILNQYAENNPNPIQNEFEFEEPFDFFAW